jgi:hypothetical protein
MPRGPAPMWTAKAAHTQEHIPIVAAALAHGYEIECKLGPYGSADDAALAKRGLFNAAKHHKCAVSVRTQHGNGVYYLYFTLHDKSVARAYVRGKYGEDRSLWPYNPRQRGSNAA